MSLLPDVLKESGKDALEVDEDKMKAVPPTRSAIVESINSLGSAYENASRIEVEAKGRNARSREEAELRQKKVELVKECVKQNMSKSDIEDLLKLLELQVIQ
jgi:hypothetical protein